MMDDQYTTQDEELIETQAAAYEQDEELDGQAVIESLMYNGFIR